MKPKPSYFLSCTSIMWYKTVKRWQEWLSGSCEILAFWDAKSALPKQHRMNSKLPQNHPQLPEDTQTTIFMDAPSIIWYMTVNRWAKTARWKLRYNFWRCIQSASPEQQKQIWKPPQNYPQHPADTQTTIFLDSHKHYLKHNSWEMGRNGPVEAEIHPFWGCKISLAQTTETNSKITPKPSTAPRWHPNTYILDFT